MRKRCVSTRRGRSGIAVLACLAVLGAGLVTGGATPPARAGGRDAPVLGDFTGNGLVDQAVLDAGNSPTVECNVLFRPGLPGGGLGPPSVHTYLLLPPSEPNCPDLGTAAKIDSGGGQELALAWFAGPPSTVHTTGLILRYPFEVIGTFDGESTPSFMGTGNFNGDALQDVYQWSDQGEGYHTYLAVRDSGVSSLVAGPEQWCANPKQLQLRDFNRNRAQDALISYIEQCADNSSGVVVVLDDGTVQHLQLDPLGLTAWSATAVHANADPIPDVLTVNLATGAQTYFIGLGDGSFVPAPTAVADHVRIPDSRRTNIPVLANDYVGPDARVTITTAPAHGTAHVTSAGSVVYQPFPGHGRADRFVYQVTEQGRRSSAAVTIMFTG
ncbi:Ig-like domain-containing protein [Micromonospora zhanjiangensis]|uniref:Ig-like domain-containing protein n=1 Tax=Micromonospora zhanjiangensis TaxID=1522057 RepID=A0ABV8KIN1_9ACTN